MESTKQNLIMELSNQVLQDSSTHVSDDMSQDEHLWQYLHFPKFSRAQWLSTNAAPWCAKYYKWHKKATSLEHKSSINITAVDCQNGSTIAQTTVFDAQGISRKPITNIWRPVIAWISILLLRLLIRSRNQKNNTRPYFIIKSLGKRPTTMQRYETLLQTFATSRRDSKLRLLWLAAYLTFARW